MQVIQIGANDGITHDPIHKFIKRDRWQGVLLEPQSSVYQNKLSKIYKKNKGIHTLCAAIGEKDGQQTLYKIGFSEMRWATGLASFNLDNVEKAYENGLVRDRCQRHGLTIPDDPKARISSEQVEVISPRSIFARYPVQQFDLLQIDTEGFDYEVIRIFDIAQSQPKAIIYENIHLSEKDRAACHQLFKENDYAFKIFGPNTLAMKRPTAAFEKFFE